MDGTESRDDIARAELWDTIFLSGPLTLSKLVVLSGIGRDRVSKLTKHAWFKTNGNAIHISRRKGSP